MLRRRVLFGLGLAIASAVAVVAAPAHADPTAQELASARQTFAEGKELEKAADYAGALEKFKQVAQVRVTPQVRFHIALCEENLGKLVSALKGFELATEDARVAGSSAIEVLENAPKRAEALRQRVAHLRVDVKGRLTTSKLTLDNAPVTREKFGADQLVDPGKHVVLLVSAKGEPLFEKELQLGERAVQAVTVPVDDHDDAPPVVVAPPPPPTGPSRVPAYIVGAIGVAGVAAGGVLYGISAVDESAAESACKQVGSQTFHCAKQSDAATGAQGKSLQTGAFIVGGAGLGVLATGVVLFFVLGPNKSKPASTSFVLAPAPRGATVSGSF
jgi:hypothetical protein